MEDICEIEGLPGWENLRTISNPGGLGVHDAFLDSYEIPEKNIEIVGFSCGQNERFDPPISTDWVADYEGYEGDSLYKVIRLSESVNGCLHWVAKEYHDGYRLNEPISKESAKRRSI